MIFAKTIIGIHCGNAICKNYTWYLLKKCCLQKLYLMFVTEMLFKNANTNHPINLVPHLNLLHSKKKSTSKQPFLVLQLVTNRGLIPVLRRTMLDGASQAPCYMVLQQTLLGPTWPINPNISAPFQELQNT